MASSDLFGWSPPHVQPLTPVPEASELSESPLPCLGPMADEGTRVMDDEMGVDGADDDMDESEPPPRSVPFKQLFRCADRFDWLLMLVGGVAAAAHGMALVVHLHFLGRTINLLNLHGDALYHNIKEVVWGTSSMVDAEKKLLANALQDPDNQHFVLLSDSCVPLHNFDYVYQFLMGTNISFVDCFEDSGPHGNGRYSEHMLPEVEKKDWRKGAQWFTVKRQHAVLILTDRLYFNKFKHYCKMVDPNGIANWSVTHVDWSEGMAPKSISSC